MFGLRERILAHILERRSLMTVAKRPFPAIKRLSINWLLGSSECAGEFQLDV